MTKISKLRRCGRLPGNARGRDFIVGDLHGHRSLFEQALQRLGFDPRHDRVLSVGDLADRGPESFATLSLLEEPWFHAVIGNHELMLLNFLGCYSSRLHSKKAFASGCGEWVHAALGQHRKAMARLVDRLAALPLALQVEGDMPFNVTHATLGPLASRLHRLADDETIGMQEADLLTSSREPFNAALKLDLLSLPFELQRVQLSPLPIGAQPITYAGHSPVQSITVHDSYVYIDQGVGLRSTKRAAATPPTVLEHRPFALWLAGVARARGAASKGLSAPARVKPASRAVAELA